MTQHVCGVPTQLCIGTVVCTFTVALSKLSVGAWVFIFNLFLV